MAAGTAMASLENYKRTRRKMTRKYVTRNNKTRTERDSESERIRWPTKSRISPRSVIIFSQRSKFIHPGQKCPPKDLLTVMVTVPTTREDREPNRGINQNRLFLINRSTCFQTSSIPWYDMIRYKSSRMQSEYWQWSYHKNIRLCKIIKPTDFLNNITWS